MKRVAWIVPLCLLLISAVQGADTITLAVNQSDFYFPRGAEPSFLITVTNPYGEDIRGMFSYAVALEQRTGPSVMHQTSSQSSSVVINSNPLPFEFRMGAQQNVGTHTFTGGTLEYTAPDGKGYVVTLPDIQMHIVDDPPEGESMGEQQSSSQTKEEQQESQRKAQEEAARQREEAIRQQMREQQGSDQFKDRMQNNQMNQNAGALQQQMQQEMEAREEQRMQIEEVLKGSEEFQQALEEVMEEGYHPVSRDIEPTGEGAGEYSFGFEDGYGNTAEISGSIDDHQVTEITVSKERSLDDIMRQIREDSRFQDLDDGLRMDGFEEGSASMERQDERTRVQIPYADETNGERIIEVLLEEDAITEIHIVEKKRLWLIIPLAMVLLALMVLLLKRRPVEDIVYEEQIDHRAEALKMLDRSQALYDDGKKKEAYAMAAAAVRYHYASKFKRGEMTNNTLIAFLVSNKHPYEEVKACLSLCGLVEFARYAPNDEDFQEIISKGRTIINGD